MNSQNPAGKSAAVVSATPKPAGASSPGGSSNFLRHLIEEDLANGTYAARHFGGSPGDAAHHRAGPTDPARIRTRFPPEPNGYLHIGHAKSICVNFGLARDYGGICHLRFDDTNPEKEDAEFVASIIDSVHWLGFDWNAGGVNHLYHASDYFGFMHRAAVYLIEAGLAYVDEQSADEMRANRGDFNNAGTNSPFRFRSTEENLERFADMREGRLPDGAAVLRAKVDMTSPNLNLRDPAIYRIRHATHHNTGDQWCIYPMYSFAHPIEDALENITHSICTLEFEDQRPFYDWLLARLVEGGLLDTPPPRQYEFARLNVTYVVTSKRKLKKLVDEGHVSGWDDARMPTIVGLRRRGYTPASLRLFAERSGVSKAGGWIDYSSLEIALRDSLDEIAPRVMAVLDPVRLTITNWDALMGEGFLDDCVAPVHPHRPDLGKRSFKFGRDLWIERGDYEETPPKGFFRLFPGNKVRLKYGHVIECTGARRDGDGKVIEVLAEVVADSKSGTPGADAVKVKGVITWVGASDGIAAEVRLYDRLFSAPQPDAGGSDFLTALNPDSLSITIGWLEPSAGEGGAIAALPEHRYQFERHGYFVADRFDHSAMAPVFNKITGLKDGWTK
ncbi:MAG: glutamine--tRNA ligase/YqeY domain fusion protein [Burkholderiales bacterium]